MVDPELDNTYNMDKEEKPKKSTMTYTDIMVLGAGHSMIVQQVPKTIPLESFVTDYPKLGLNKESLESYGLFTNPINCSTYYKDVNKEDLKPSDEDYVEPLYRLLSSAVVAKKYSPTDFSAPGLLKNSMHLLKGQTVYCNHDAQVGSEIGVIKEVVWQDEFIQDGIVVPAGINGILKIDGKSNPKIARGIMMDPPSIHSNSVTVTFKWVPSHNFDNMWEFWDKLGTYDDNGELIRKIVTEIISYQETSLVPHGADPFAQIIKDGKLNHIAYAANQYYGTMQNKEALLKNLPNTAFDCISFKQISNIDKFVDTMKNSDNPGNSTNNHNQKTHKEMEKEDIKVEDLFGEGLLSLDDTNDGAVATLDLAKAQIAKLIQENLTLKQQSETYESSKCYIEIGKATLETTRNEALTNYKKLAGDKPETAILQLLGSNTSVEVLRSLNNTYVQQLDDKFPMSCSKCGSKEVSRASSLITEDTEGNSEEAPENNAVTSAIKLISQQKLK